MSLRNKLVFKGERGASLTEYGIIVGLISAVAIGSVSVLGQEVDDTFSTVSTTFGEKAQYAAARSGIAGAGGAEATGGATQTPSTPPADIDPVLVGYGGYQNVRDGAPANLAIPASIQDGDYMIATIMYNSNSGAPPTVPAGWTEIQRVAAAGGYWEMRVFTKDYQSSDGSAVSFPANNAYQIAGQIYALRGDNIGLVSVDTSTGSGATHMTPGATSVDAGSFALSGMLETWSSANPALMEYSGNWTQTDPTTKSWSRMSLAYQVPADTGAQIGATEVYVDTMSNYDWASFVLQFDELQ